jgi:hypothetical protein
MLLIGLHGPAGSGKTTVGQILGRLGFDRYAFADPLKAGLDAMFDLGDSLHGREKERIVPWIGKSVRELMQTLGTEWGRGMVDEDIWLRCAARAIDESTAGSSRGLVITDVRFSNEAQWIRKRGGRVWHIQRPIIPITGHHSSEAGIPRGVADIVVLNTGDVEDLVFSVARALLRSVEPVPTAAPMPPRNSPANQLGRDILHGGGA